MFAVSDELAGYFVTGERKFQHAGGAIGASLNHAAHGVEGVSALVHSGFQGGFERFLVCIGVAAAGDTSILLQGADQRPRARQLRGEGHLSHEFAVLQYRPPFKG